MPNSYFQFKQFTIHQDRSAMKVTTDGCLFGAWLSEQVRSNKYEVRSGLDIGTGTGLLSLMLAQKNPLIRIDAIEIDQGAFEQATENALSSPWKNVNIIHADVKNFQFDRKYDVIFSNPPFYDKELKSDDPRKNIAHHNEGLRLPELLKIIDTNLAPGGSFFLLLPFKRNEEIKTLIGGQGMHVTHTALVRQTPEHKHFRIMLAGQSNRSGIGTELEDIVVKDEQQAYTERFRAPLKDYYLDL